MFAQTHTGKSLSNIEAALVNLSRRRDQQVAVIMLGSHADQHEGLESLLKQALNPDDLIFEHPDQAYVVLKPLESTGDNTASAAHHLAKQVNCLLAEQSQHVHVGAATHPDAFEDPQETLFLAHCALGWSQTGSSTDVVTLDHEHIRTRNAKTRLLSDLAGAAENNELELYLQPIISANSGKTIGAEALLRWNHPKLGLLSPDFFIPIAESYGLLGNIGLWVLRETCEIIARQTYSSKGAPFYISLNVSASQIPEEINFKTVSEQLKKYGLSGEQIVFEITEGLPHRCEEATRQWMKEIQSLGIRVFMDDFGIGHSSPLLLKRLPFDAVKIDRLFVQNISCDSDELAFLKSMLQVPLAKGLPIIAEGVDNIDHIALLQTVGCERLQGYLFAPPLPSVCLDSMLRTTFPLNKIGQYEAHVN